MSDQTPVEGTEAPAPIAEGEQTEAPEAPSFEDRISQRLDEMAQSIQSVQQIPQQFEQFQQQFVGDDDEEEYVPEPGDDGFEEWQQEQAFQQAVDARVQQALTPLQQQQQEIQRNQAFDQLRSQYTELQDADLASKIVGQAAQDAEQMGVNTSSPAFVRLIEYAYAKHVADTRASQETPAGSRPEVQLESGGGAAPQDREEDIQDRIVAAAQRARPQI